MQPLPNHPYVTYQAGPDASGHWWIRCACSYCGDRWDKPCYYPQKTNLWLMRYGQQHGHGLRARVTRAGR
jgi:hypothetical protein